MLSPGDQIDREHHDGHQAELMEKVRDGKSSRLVSFAQRIRSSTRRARGAGPNSWSTALEMTCLRRWHGRRGVILCPRDTATNVADVP